MIFGKTSSQKFQEEQARKWRSTLGIAKFAWLPKRLVDGRWVWMETVVQRQYRYVWESCYVGFVQSIDRNLFHTELDWMTSDDYGKACRTLVEKAPPEIREKYPELVQAYEKVVGKVSGPV